MEENMNKLIKLSICVFSIILALNPIAIFACEIQAEPINQHESVSRVIITKEITIQESFGFGVSAPDTIVYEEYSGGVQWRGTLIRGSIAWIDHLFVAYYYSGTLFGNS